MLRIWLIVLICAGLMTATENGDILKRADNALKSSSKTEQFRAYNDYKNLYLRALMDGDDTLRLASLKGIVGAGDKLRIDVAKYQEELKSLKVTPPAPVKTTGKSAGPTKKIILTERNHLNDARWHEDKLLLKFGSKPDTSKIKHFKLYDPKKKRYRYVFDFRSSMLHKQHTLRHDEINRIQLAQYDPKTVRFVIENDKKLAITYDIDGNNVIFDLGVSAVVSPVSEQPVRPVDKKVIVIDPGHGGKDPGSVGYKRYREKIVVMQVGQKVASILRKRGHTVHLTRSKDKFIKLRSRTGYANRKKADLFVSIHANAVPKRNAKKAHGIETYFLSPARSERAKKVAATENSDDVDDMNFYGKQSFLNFLNTEKIIASNKLAIDIQKGMLSEVRKQYKDVKDGGVREGPFWILVGAQMPAVLVEVGFISHPKEARRLVKKKYQKALAQGIADGIERYFANNR